MTAERVAVISCDGCTATLLGHPGETVAGLRDRADLQHSWVTETPRRGRTRDYCTNHRR